MLCHAVDGDVCVVALAAPLVALAGAGGLHDVVIAVVFVVVVVVVVVGVPHGVAGQREKSGSEVSVLK